MKWSHSNNVHAKPSIRSFEQSRQGADILSAGGNKSAEFFRGHKRAKSGRGTKSGKSGSISKRREGAG